MRIKQREWRRTVGDQTYLISTDRASLDEGFIRGAFATDDMHWAKDLPREELTRMLDNSLTLGVYALDEPSSIPPPQTSSEPSTPRSPSPTVAPPLEEQKDMLQIGLARLITDDVTTAYLTDVYVDPTRRRAGLGKFLMECVKDIMNDMVGLRRLLMVTTRGTRLVDWFVKELGMHEMTQESIEPSVICMSTNWAEKIP